MLLSSIVKGDLLEKILLFSGLHVTNKKMREKEEIHQITFIFMRCI
jgi:hypothetical protein